MCKYNHFSCDGHTYSAARGKNCREMDSYGGYGSPIGHKNLHAHRSCAVWATCGNIGYRSIGSLGYRCHHGHRSRRPPQYTHPLTHASFVFVSVFSSTLLCGPPFSKMVRSRDRSGKRKATSLDSMAPPDVDVVALRQHSWAAGERRSKAREDVRNVPPSRSRAHVKRPSPPPKRSWVIEVSTSGEEAEEGDHSEGMSDRQQSWRYVWLSHLNYTLSCCRRTSA